MGSMEIWRERTGPREWFGWSRTSRATKGRCLSHLCVSINRSELLGSQKFHIVLGDLIYPKSLPGTDLCICHRTRWPISSPLEQKDYLLCRYQLSWGRTPVMSSMYS